MGSAPSGVMIAVADVAANVRFLELFGFRTRETTSMPGGAFGRTGTVEQVVLGQPGREAGAIHLVATDAPARPRGHFDHGGIAVDVYTRDADETRRVAASVGHACRPVELIELGPISMRQLHVTAPGGWSLVFVESERRRPSLLDTTPDALHSEVHSVIWGVDLIEAATPAWEAQGLEQQHLFPMSLPAVSRVMGLPREDVALRMNLLADDEQTPIRVELMDFPDDKGRPARDDLLTPGIAALVFGDEPGKRSIFRG